MPELTKCFITIKRKQLHTKLKILFTTNRLLMMKRPTNSSREGCWRDSYKAPSCSFLWWHLTANASPLHLTPSQQDLHKDRSPFCRRALLLFFNGGVAVARDMGGGILLSELSGSLTRLNFLPGWSTAVWRTLPSSLPRSHWRLAGTYCTALLLPASVSPQPSNYFELCFLFWGCNKVF